jgi:hypothetical protein
MKLMEMDREKILGQIWIGGIPGEKEKVGKAHL